LAKKQGFLQFLVHKFMNINRYIYNYSSIHSSNYISGDRFIIFEDFISKLSGSYISSYISYLISDFLRSYSYEFFYCVPDQFENPLME